jgi:hypothetical protein
MMVGLLDILYWETGRTEGETFLCCFIGSIGYFIGSVNYFIGSIGFTGI